MDIEAFHAAYAKVAYSLDSEKRAIVDSDATETLHVVAGPGTGKTTALVARILKIIMVDQVPPTAVLATTFTKKAAAELRSRLLEVGLPVQLRLLEERLSTDDIEWLDSADLNQVWTGTTDSLCQELLTSHHAAGETAPVVIDDYVAETVMLQKGLFNHRRDRDPNLSDILRHATGRSPRVPGQMASELIAIRQRIEHDQIDLARYSRSGPLAMREGRKMLRHTIADYVEACEARSFADYAALESVTLERLRAGHFSQFTKGLRAVFVDEYQDTNLLQEALYVELAKQASGAIMVVGDDDQSLYRFRGATVELFVDFPRRVRKPLRTRPTTLFLTRNHRSSRPIVDFVNQFATTDPDYQPARSASKPPLAGPSAQPQDVPILAMFRPTREILARDLTDLLHKVFRGRGYRLPSGERIQKGPGGDLGDAVLLTSSPKEDRDDRLTSLLRAEFEKRPRMLVFNPRGYPPTEYPELQELLGLMLTSLDPNGNLVTGQGMPRGARTAMADWQRAARRRLSHAGELRKVVRTWQQRETDLRWPDRTPVLDLMYSLAQLLDDLVFDAEKQLLVELVARQVTTAELLGSYRSQVLLNRAGTTRTGRKLGDGSVAELIRYVFVPLASGVGKLNEELIEDFPRDRLPILSIHQSKGLEFPLAIVDVGSRFGRKHPMQTRMRFPSEGDGPHRLEDEFRKYGPLGQPARSQIDRAFDDLIRQYFVAFSRARNVLLLVGLDAARPTGSIPNVALGWARRDYMSKWTNPSPYLEI